MAHFSANSSRGASNLTVLVLSYREEFNRIKFVLIHSGSQKLLLVKTCQLLVKDIPVGAEKQKKKVKSRFDKQ